MSEPDLQDSLIGVWAALAGPPAPTRALFHWPGHPTGGPDPESVMPHKWRVVPGSREAKIVGRETMVVVVGGIDGVRGRRSGIAVLGSRELVVLTDATGDVRGARFGFDVLAVPRARLRSLCWDGALLTICAGAADTAPGDQSWQPAVIEVELDPGLGEAMREAFANEVRWD